MLCACYGSNEEDLQFQTPVKSGWVLARQVSHAFALERRRWVVLRTWERGATLSYYADDGARRLLGAVPLGKASIVGEASRTLRVNKPGHPAEGVLSLRFEGVEEKLEWWRKLRAASRRAAASSGEREESSPVGRNGRSPSTTPALEDAGEEGVTPRSRRSSESAAGERVVVWESHGMCVVEDTDGRMSVEPRLVYSARVAYGRIVRAFIRPPRAEYEMAALGPRAFALAGRSFVRRDKQARNARGRLVRYSVWREVEEAVPRATVLYAHGNASSRVEGLSQLALTLSLGPGVQFVALDCCGSGRSEGEFCSLGLKEQEDVVAVVDAERASDGLGRLVLWGRSMGAVTALLVAATREPDVAALVVDSAYSSLRQLSLDVARAGAAGVPAVVARSALRWIRDSVSRRAGFDIFEVDALKHVPDCVAPAFFVCAADDAFVDASHTARLHDAIASKTKELCVCPGSHNTTRPKECFDRIELFLRAVLDLDTPAAPFASALDADLLPMLPEARRADRPNFAALAPWTIENLKARRRDAADFSPAPRWLCDDEDRGQATVQEMQSSTLAAAQDVARLV
mmetsp:Transcript_7810/g.23906  ORF Transcript_7810/g.23906 Transcript_7810/m.23906 type:complete len:573 (-) Transcript_7810:395-2113(-)